MTMTKTVHRTTIVAQCPHGGVDVYQTEFHVGNRTVTVESIQTVIDAVVKNPVYQEDLTRQLANTLNCEVVTLGSHGRFQTECHAVAEALP